MRENESDKREQSTSFEKAGCILPFFSFVADLIFGVFGLQFGVLNVIIFSLFVILFVLIWIWITNLYYIRGKERAVRYKTQKKQYRENCGENVDVIEFYSEIDKIKRRYVKQCESEKKRYVITSLILIVAIILNGYMSACQIKAMREEKETEQTLVGMNASANENTAAVETTIINEVDGNHGITLEQKKEMEEKTFILNEPKRLRMLSDIDEESVFYVTMDPGKLEDEVKEHKEGIYNQKKTSSFFEVGTMQGRLVEETQTAEDIFLHDRDEAQRYKTQENYEGWKSTIPSASDLEEIMGDREILLTPSGEYTEDAEFNWVLCIRLANNNQLFADEYRLQGGKPETVVCYYVESIKWTEAGLAYDDMPQKDKTEYYGYLKARYKDIADFIENNLEKFGAEKEKYQQLMEKANAIYKTM